MNSQPMRLYSYWRSSASYRVRIALAHKGLRYEYVAVHLLKHHGEQHQVAYRAINPQGRVPALAIDDQLLTQSSAILEYLEETHPQPALLPADAYGRARVRALAAIIASDIQPLQNLSVTQYLQSQLGLDSAAITTWVHEWIDRGLSSIETHLVQDHATRRYCHGNTPSLADICLVPQCYAARRFKLDMTRYPTISRIDAACNELPAFQQAAPEAQPDAER